MTYRVFLAQQGGQTRNAWLYNCHTVIGIKSSTRRRGTGREYAKGPYLSGRKGFPEEMRFEEVILEPNRALNTCYQY